MIYLFRKEIKKWNAVWWLVIASLAFGLVGGSFYLLRTPRKETLRVASVNGSTITLETFMQTFGEMKSSLDDLALYWGIPVERLSKMMGVRSFSEAALEKCVQSAIIDGLANSFNMKIDETSFQDALAATMSRTFIDKSGKLNLAAYQNYLSRLRMSVKDYENNKEKEFKRSMVFRLIENGAYVPSYLANELFEKKKKKKSFHVLHLPFEHFLAEAKQKTVSDDELKKFFEERKELYRVPEKKKIKYWVLTPEEYKEKIEVDDSLIERFYEKNKSALYRIPPKVKVRTIVFSMNENASPDVLAKAKEEAEKVRAEAVESPDQFISLVKKHSRDKETSKDGGLINFFSRGTHDPEFEKVAFLKLKKKGDISEVVKTNRGFEIIKLEDRISASEKPLASVREEIIKTLIDKKAIITLRSDLEAVIRTARNDKSIFEKFSDSNNLKTNETDWVTEEDARGYELVNVLAQKLFGDRKAGSSNGYFVHRGEHVLYKAFEKKESFVPSLDQVKDRVQEDLYKNKAEEGQKKKVSEIKKALLEGTTSIDEAGKEDFTIIRTGFVRIDGEVKTLSDVGNIIEKAFSLQDPSQVLEHGYDNDCYLVTFVGQQDDDSVKAEAKEEAGEKDSEKSRLKQRYLDAFVASLQRNAKIEVDQKTLKIAGGLH